jgi:hypothetical protein
MVDRTVIVRLGNRNRIRSNGPIRRQNRWLFRGISVDDADWIKAIAAMLPSVRSNRITGSLNVALQRW